MGLLCNYYHPLSKLNRKRERYIKNNDLPDNIKALLSAPLPTINDNLFHLDYVSVDFETTGFYPENDRLLSVGYLPLSKEQLIVSEAVETYIQSSEKIKPETAIINHIVPEMLENGSPLHEVMDKLFSAITGKVLIAHGCDIEKRFIDYYLAQHFKLPPLPLLWVDTLSIEKSFIMHKGNQKSADFRLASIRKRHGLPEYPAHGALIDAVATGELYLALLKKRFAGGTPCFRRLKV